MPNPDVSLTPREAFLLRCALGDGDRRTERNWYLTRPGGSCSEEWMDMERRGVVKRVRTDEFLIETQAGPQPDGRPRWYGYNMWVVTEPGMAAVGAREGIYADAD